ncbi:unnamed protein product [Candidula unifasciata]|uniref:Mutator-like transposase domain-containing protein n=2 Tax=Candidula unifasciata TaxID=100452 RepID=A0A8S3YWX9_9EUPU|nr:unnamed protein product [Candidula unifasciata]
MGKRKINRGYRPRKRSFHGNQYSDKHEQEAGSDEISGLDDKNRPSTSASKIKLGPQTSQTEFDTAEELTGFRFVDVQLLINFVKTLLCSQCGQPLGENKSFVTEERSSLASTFTFHCQCQQKVSFMSSAKCGKTYEVNRRYTLALFAIGRNYMHGKKFLGNMNMPTGMHKSSWSLHKKKILHATETVARTSMQRVAAEIKQKKGEAITVSCDGTWQRRGFQSKNGVVTLLTVDGPNSKVLDTAVLSNYCNPCAKNKKTKTEAEFQAWKLSHAQNCDKNHSGSAGSMEPTGALEMFRRSEQLYGLRYASFLGDGDSKSYTSVANAEPPVYTDVDIAKLECCGHVQKRMGRHLTNKVNELKKETFMHNGKSVRGIGGRGCLTKKSILKIQGHYGAAIRRNTNNVPQMRKEIWAIWQHRNRDHINCGDWCPSKNQPAADPDRNAFPPYVCEAIRPVFETLTSETLLSKCAHGGTQNTNESFHNSIWQRCPKTGFVGRPRLTLAVYDATVVFNDGERGRIPIFENLGMPSGLYTRLCFSELDRTRINSAATKLSPSVRQARRIVAVMHEKDKEDFYLAGAHE